MKYMECMSITQLSVSGKLISHIRGSLSGGKCNALCLHVCLRCSRLLFVDPSLSYHCKKDADRQREGYTLVWVHGLEK